MDLVFDLSQIKKNSKDYKRIIKASSCLSQEKVWKKSGERYYYSLQETKEILKFIELLKNTESVWVWVDGWYKSKWLKEWKDASFA